MQRFNGIRRQEINRVWITKNHGQVSQDLLMAWLNTIQESLHKLKSRKRVKFADNDKYIWDEKLKWQMEVIPEVLEIALRQVFSLECKHPDTK